MNVFETCQFRGVNPNAGEKMEVAYKVDSRLHETHLDQVGDKDMGLTQEQEAKNDVKVPSIP